ncbi:polysaccharide biosynthesis/export family protein [Thiothrix lacustris]|uniref:Polysaccharide biosynthesis/export family protein n=1 Tax=Thiothrix lacustris TaxID=525917 RepID=A0ABY9MQE2_9GAMM|nr:polysaccharide biosynthesis/export family protein [Thiothrix lacustris]WML90390.1 polysaccharide biosynthesis/export family protein [Thiothrix lacustris]
MNAHKYIMKTFLSVVTLSGVAGISACSTTGTAPNSTGATTLSDSSIFANVNELDYSASLEQATIAAGDMLDIKVFQADELSGKVRVDTNGQISLPLIGALTVAGSSPIEVENQLKVLLGQKYLQNPQITVFMENFTNQRITIEGEVKKPGVYPITGSVTLLQSVALGEGLSSLADDKKIVLFRRIGEKTKAYHLDLNAIRAGTMRDPYLRGDDRVIVHRSDSRYWLRETATLLSPLSTLNTILR